LAFICEDGEMFGEEYTLVACADYVLVKPWNTVSNMSSSRIDVTNRNNGSYEASAVRVNVVDLMKRTTPL
jgi:phosphomannomutase